MCIVCILVREYCRWMDAYARECRWLPERIAPRDQTHLMDFKWVLLLAILSILVHIRMVPTSSLLAWCCPISNVGLGVCITTYEGLHSPSSSSSSPKVEYTWDTFGPIWFWDTLYTIRPLQFWSTIPPMLFVCFVFVKNHPLLFWSTPNYRKLNDIDFESLITFVWIIWNLEWIFRSIIGTTDWYFSEIWLHGVMRRQIDITIQFYSPSFAQEGLASGNSGAASGPSWGFGAAGVGQFTVGLLTWGEVGATGAGGGRVGPNWSPQLGWSLQPGWSPAGCGRIDMNFTLMRPIRVRNRVFFIMIIKLTLRAG